MLSPNQYLLFASISLLLIALFLLRRIKKNPLEKNLSHQVSALVIDGIRIYGLRSFSSILQIILYTSIVLQLGSFILNKPFYWEQIGAFFLGGLSMSVSLFVIAGLIPRLIPRVINQSKGYLTDAIHMQFNCITMLGFLVVGCLFFIGLLLYTMTSYTLLIGYGLGIVFSSFFMRIGGGLFKASIDIAKNTSKTLHKTLATDERNPGTLLDISGDYIGKICGFSSDIMGSLFLSFLATLIFGHAFEKQSILSEIITQKLTALPFHIITISIVGSICGVLIAKFRINQNKTNNVLLESLYIALFICGVGTALLMQNIPHDISASIWTGTHNFQPFLAYLTGLIGAAIICYSSEILTSHTYPFAKKIAQHTQFSSPITQLMATSLGLKSNAVYLIIILSICGSSYLFSGLYGIALTSLGMLSVSTTLIAIYSFSPLSNSTHSIASYSTSSETILKHTQKMKTIGQSTIAIGNGFSTASGLLSSFALFLAFMCWTNYSFSALFTINFLWLIGLLLGIFIPLISSGFLITVCINNVLSLTQEIKRQFQEIPFLSKGKAKPDIIKIADKTARHCMDGLIIPGILTALIPIIIGYAISLPMLIAFTLGALLIGAALSYHWAISGDVINNAKHYIKQGHCGGEKSVNYVTIKQNDTIANIYKDVLSPNLVIMMKSIMILSTIMLVFLK